VINVYDIEATWDNDDPPGYGTGYVRIGKLLGASGLAATVYELPPGQSVCPYHWEQPCEEWLLVLDGRPTLRDPDGEHELAVGDFVCFPAGPDGAHKVTNRSDATARVLILSTKDDAAVVVYPDSDKIGVWPPGKLFRFGDAVDYWDGER
jgi:uncharacterized cupin superfamily protein